MDIHCLKAQMFNLFKISSPTKKIKEPTKFDAVRRGEHFMSDPEVQS